MFYLRLNKVKILNNRELLGKAELQLMSFVNIGDKSFPLLGEFFNTNDAQRKEQIIAEATKQVLSSRIFLPIQKIKDYQTITFGDTGYVLFKSEKIPDDFNWLLLAVELDDKTRSNAALVEEILTKDNITTVVNSIAALATISNPVAGAGVALTKFVADSLVRIYKNDKDDQIGVFMTSFIREIDYKHGNREGVGVPDATGNIRIDYSILGFEQNEINNI